MRRGAAAEAAVAVLAVVLLGSSSLIYPFGKDQAEYGYTAVAALSGKVVYRDAFVLKPPLTFVVHELALLAFGRTMLAIRLMDLVWQALTVLVLLRVSHRAFGGATAGLVAALLYALSYFGLHYWGTAQTDGFLNLPVALAVLLFLRGRESGRAKDFAACGAALGTAVLFKYPIGILLPLLAVGGLRPALLMALGFGAPLLVCGAMLAAQGGLRDFVSFLLQYLPPYVAETGGASGYGGTVLLNAARAFRHDLALQLSAAAIVVALHGARRSPPLRSVVPVALWWVAGFVHFAVQNRHWAYHALPFLPPMALLLAHVLTLAHDALRSRRVAVRALRAALVALLAWGYVAFDYPWRHRALLGVLRGATTLEATYALPAFGRYGAGDYSIVADLEVARYLEARSGPADTVFVWGYEPAIYFLSNRPCASRFMYNVLLYGDRRLPGLREPLPAELAASRPLFIVVARNDAAPWITGTTDDSETAFRKFDALREVVAASYGRETAIEDFTIYRRLE